MRGIKMAAIYLYLLAITLLKLDSCVGLSITRMVVPTPVVVGEAVWLACDFKEEKGENVYALKWYLGLDEFYRWMPADSETIKTFPVTGNALMVDTTVSNHGNVKILNVELGATGMFRCEVSAEAPSFHTESKEHSMTVLDLPDEKPVITGVQSSYQFLDQVNINCSSPRSQPPATLHFYINDELTEEGWLIRYPPVEDRETGLETAVLGLRFPLRPILLQRGPALVKCEASIMDRYKENSQVYLHTDAPYQASIMEGRASAAGDVDISSLWRTVSGMALLWILLLLH